MNIIFGTTESADLEAIPSTTPKKRGWLPLLTILFLISYGLMTMLIVEQGQTIESQRALIRELFRDSSELSATKIRAQQEQHALAAQALAQNPSSQAPSAKTPSTQAPSIHAPSTQAPNQGAIAQAPMKQAPSSQAVPQHRPKSQIQMPSKPASDLADKGRTLITI